MLLNYMDEKVFLNAQLLYLTIFLLVPYVTTEAYHFQSIIFVNSMATALK